MFYNYVHQTGTFYISFLEKFIELPIHFIPIDIPVLSSSFTFLRMMYRDVFYIHKLNKKC